jgi:hypothetical protein
MCLMQLAAAVLLFPSTTSANGGFGVVLDHVRTIGPGPWVRMVTDLQLQGVRSAVARWRPARSGPAVGEAA